VGFSVAGDGYLVESDDPQMLAQLARWAGPLRSPTGADALRIRMRTQGVGAPCLELERGRRLVQEAAEDLLPALEGFLYHRLSRVDRGLTVLHAAVAARGKRAALFLGESGAGKSVLSLRLARRGWTYLSDDLAPLEGAAEGAARVLALPRPVTFDAAEIDGVLWREVSADCVTWESRYRTPQGDERVSLHACPRGAAKTGAAFDIAAVYQLRKRSGRAPSLHRMRGPEARAWIFAARATRQADAVAAL
jgi:hypothetical protein